MEEDIVDQGKESSWSAYYTEDDTYLGESYGVSLDTESFVTADGKHLGSGVVNEKSFDTVIFRFPLRFGCQTQITGLFKTQLLSSQLIIGWNIFTLTCRYPLPKILYMMYLLLT